MRIYGKIEVCVMKKLDKVDKKIIQILQKNARTPLKEIAAQVFLSSPSVSARIEKLEHEGVITGGKPTVPQLPYQGIYQPGGGTITKTGILPIY